jgi:Zn-dependent protease
VDLDDLRFAAYLAVALVPALVLHEYAHALAADRLGDPSPRRWGRLTLNPRPLVDPFGSVILPALALVLIAARGMLLLPVFAYAKPMPLDPSALRDRARGPVLVTLAGLVANLSLAVLGGVAIRAGAAGDLGLFARAWLIVNSLMFAFQLMPIPGLDGAKLLARVLPPRAREVYTNLEQYLVLFILVIFFLLSGPLFAIVEAFADIACTIASGAGCFGP